MLGVVHLLDTEGALPNADGTWSIAIPIGCAAAKDLRHPSVRLSAYLPYEAHQPLRPTTPVNHNGCHEAVPRDVTSEVIPALIAAPRTACHDCTAVRSTGHDCALRRYADRRTS